MWKWGVMNVCVYIMGCFFDKEIEDDVILCGMQKILFVLEVVVVLLNWQFFEGIKVEIELVKWCDMQVVYLSDFILDVYNCVVQVILGENICIVNVGDVE